MTYPRAPRKQPSPAEVLAKAQREADRRKVEDRLLLQLKAWRLPTPEREVRFHPTRLWRFDLAWREFKLAVEVDGITHGQAGRHQQAHGFENDRAKDLAARELGWDLIHVTPRQVLAGEAVQAIARALERRSGVRA